MSPRLSDFALAVAHLWLCPECRRKFLADPPAMLAGLKLSSAQWETLMALAESPEELPERLGSVPGLDNATFTAAIAHPRARLRHLGVQRRHAETQPFPSPSR